MASAAVPVPAAPCLARQRQRKVPWSARKVPWSARMSRGARVAGHASGPSRKALWVCAFVNRFEDVPYREKAGDALFLADLVEKAQELHRTVALALANVDWAGLWQAAARPVLAATLVAALLSTAMAVPGSVLAASGGRMGGSSFSSSRSGGSSFGGGGFGGYRSGGGGSSLLTGGSSLLRTQSLFYPAPMMGPTVVYSNGGGADGMVTLIFVAFFAFVAFQIVQGIRTGAGDEGGISLGGDSVGVARLQVGLLGSARELQSELERIADKADTSTAMGLHYVLTETVLALLRNPQYWVYGSAGSANLSGMAAAERRFNEISLEERGKLSEETLVNVGGRKKSKKVVVDGSDNRNEFIVVTILAAADGGLKMPPITDAASLKTALGRLGALASDQVQAVEVMWTPEQAGDVLTQQDLNRDYPNLVSI